MCLKSRFREFVCFSFIIRYEALRFVIEMLRYVWLQPDLEKLEHATFRFVPLFGHTTRVYTSVDMGKVIGFGWVG